MRLKLFHHIIGSVSFFKESLVYILSHSLVPFILNFTETKPLENMREPDSTASRHRTYGRPGIKKTGLAQVRDAELNETRIESIGH